MSVEIDANLLEYIKKTAASNMTKGDIYKELLNQGWSLEIVEKAYKAATYRENKAEIQQRTIKIILGIAVALIAVGIFSFIASNWQYLGKVMKILIIIIAMIGAYSAGWYFAEVKKYTRLGKSLILLGMLIYGAGIFLVAQMFNIRANWPDGFILWMMGTLLMAYLMDEFVYYYLAIILGLVAVFGYPTDLFGFGSANNIFLFTSTIVLICTTVITFFIGFIMWKRAKVKINQVN